ncbi:hypothetical protein J6S35_00460 [Candidatus Saccharibacteria bacterium]|nr:hypothetical protein [Candidatus Saccharibacteria bacterium]
MTASLEEYVAKATQAYQPATNALQSQLDSLEGKLANTNEQINRNYVQQQADLNRQRNMAAESASMQAAGSGGSFGGSANLANRRYYDKTFVPAVTQMKTNQANDLASARQANDDLRNSLNSQLANTQAQANQQALAQYYSDQEAERNRQAQLQAQREAQAAQNAYYQYLMEAAKNNQRSYSLDSNKNMYGGYNWYDPDGNAVKISAVAQADGGDFNNALYNRLRQAAQNGDGDYYSAVVYNLMSDGLRFEPNVRNIQTGNSMWDTLGIIPIAR